MENIKPSKNAALLVIDVQNCFMPTGSLPVNKADEVVGFINKIAPKFDNVILTQDWHPAGHISFASTHKKSAFSTITLNYGEQVLWTDHAIQGSFDAEIHSDINIHHSQLIVRKGYHEHCDSYSAFLEADRKTSTGLTGYLREREINTLYLVGLATDFCVAWSALDARDFNFRTIVIEEGCRAINLNGSLAKAWNDMTNAGVERV